MFSVQVNRFARLVNTVCRYRHKMAVYDYKYEEAVKILNELQCHRMLSVEQKYEGIGLAVMRQFLDRVQVTTEDIDKMKIIHVSGTKGKGSTCAFVESILRHSGITTGFFSSPHLIEVRERIRINGRPISQELFTKYFWEVYERLENSKDCYEVKTPSYFYFLTVLGFYAFKHEKISGVVMEVGIGGAYDCTNVIDHPVVCGVASLGIDHTKLLGDTIESIAWQKAGIFKPNIPAYTVNQPPGAMEVLQQRAKELGTTISIVPEFSDYFIETEKNLKLGLSGEHQKCNASLAIQLAKCWLKQQCAVEVSPTTISPAIAAGLSTCKWNGRAQVIKFKTITFYLDGAHTMRSMKCATKWFLEESNKEQEKLNQTCERVLAFNITNERDAYKLLSILHPCSFTNSVFTPNIATLIPSDFNDQNNLKHPVEDRLIRVLSNRDDWIELCQSQPQNNISNSVVFPSISNAVCWLSKDRDSKLYDQALAMTVDYLNPEPILSTSHLQVLVTGSLHLVGGYLRILKPDIND